MQNKGLPTDKKYRVATYSDLEEIVRLDLASNLTYWTIGQYQEALSSKSQKVLLLEKNGIIVAVLVLLVVLDQADILQLAVLPAYQRQGIACEFLSNELNNLIQNHGVQKFILEVRIDNQSAINLYLSLGFKKIGLRRNYYTIKDKTVDAVIMSLEANV